MPASARWSSSPSAIVRRPRAEARSRRSASRLRRARTRPREVGAEARERPDGSARPASRRAPASAHRSRPRPRPGPRAPAAPAPAAVASAHRARSDATSRASRGGCAARGRCRTGSGGACPAPRRAVTVAPIGAPTCGPGQSRTRGRCHRAADEVRPQARRGPIEGVALRHRSSVAPAAPGRRRSAGGRPLAPPGRAAGDRDRSEPAVAGDRPRVLPAQHEPAVGRAEAGREERARATATPPIGRPSTRDHRQLAQPPVGDERAQRRDGRCATAGSSAAGRVWNDEPPRSSVQGCLPVHDDDVRSGGAGQRPSIVVAAARPRQGGAVRIRGIGRGEHVNVAVAAGPGSRSARSRSTAPGSANWAAPSPSTK